MESAPVMQQLWHDHRVSAHLLDVLERCLEAAARGEGESLQVMRDVVARERDYADRVHHAREELLFSRLASRDGSGADAVEGLAHDHNELARMGQTLRETLENALDGHPVDAQSLRVQVDGYAGALRNHMRKEEQRVFPLAERLLRHEDWILVQGAFAGAADPLAPPVVAEYRALDAWLERNGEPIYEGG